MLVKVVEALAIAAVLFREPDAETMVGRLDGCALAAPFFLSFELATICLTRCDVTRQSGDCASALSNYSGTGA